MRNPIRKLLSLVLAFCLLLSCLPAVSAADSGTLPGSKISWSYQPSTGKLTISGSGPMPDNENMPGWLKYKWEIRSVVIKDGVTTVGPYSFWCCYELSEVSLPESVTQINNDAFHSCEKLASIKLPSKLTYIEGDAFTNCVSLTAIDIPGTVSTLRGRIFGGCTSLSSITLHSGLTAVGDNVFSGLPAKKILLPGTVTAIEKNAFEGSAITEIDIPNSVKTIGYRAFCSCGNLKKVTVHSGLKSIEDSAFLNTPVEVFITHSWGCTFSPYDNEAFGYGPVTVYGYPGSTAQDYIENLRFPHYTFKPLYFDDVAPEVWYFDSVVYAKEHELFSGVGERSFAPDKAMTRAMVVQVLYNYAGNDEVCENSFSDVAKDAWYAPAVSWAAAQNVVNGTGDGMFHPDGLLTREQFATILYRFHKQQGGDVSKTADLTAFPDEGSVSDWAKEAVSWAVAEGILTGSSRDGKAYLLPRANATRAQAAAILSRYHEMADLA